jgi:hypothetical protein
MRCDADPCLRPDAEIPEPPHAFNGYGYRVRFHPECCPITNEDGPDCDKQHPALHRVVALAKHKYAVETRALAGEWDDLADWIQLSWYREAADELGIDL